LLRIFVNQLLTFLILPRLESGGLFVGLARLLGDLPALSMMTLLKTTAAVESARRVENSSPSRCPHEH